MNRQLVAFLSLFSLVLVLSVYYVMMPSNNNTIDNTQEVSGILIKDNRTLYFETLDLEREQSHKEYIDSMIDVYEGVSTEYTLEEAYININNRNKIIKDEEKVKSLLKSMGYASCYVEINNLDSIKVLVYSEKKEISEIDQIIYQVQKLLDREISTFIVEFQE